MSSPLKIIDLDTSFVVIHPYLPSPSIHLGTSFPTPRDHQHHLLRITAVLALGLHTVCRQFHVSARVERLSDKPRRGLGSIKAF